MSQLKEQLEDLADRFDQEWQRGTRPAWHLWLERVEGDAARSELFELLVPIELEYRLKLGEVPSPIHDYPTATRRQRQQMDRLLVTLRAEQGSPASKSSRADDNRPAAIRLGPYLLQRRLGQGGMGEVWLAEQQAPVQRQVAIKLIKNSYSGSREIQARFAAERRVLSLMSHHNIARILDGGTTPEGLPYFVMELVPGLPLNEYCDRHKLSIKERLKLFCDVCSGVQHAHQKGVIHRDLKPSNILVSEIDGRPVPKIIDFGLSKVLAPELKVEHSLVTGVGQILGTLKYMSPEQAGLDLSDIDTRSDIYTLGAILYELLTGGTPLDESVEGSGTLKLLEIIRDSEPLKPSSRLSSSSREVVAKITARRQTEAGHLQRILANDLDWVVMKSLERDRRRRYDSAAGLAADIARYLAGEPVVARPPSIGYRIQKFCRRYRAGVLAASLLGLALIGGTVGTCLGMFRAQAAERATALERDKTQVALERETLARRAVIQQRDRAEQNLQFARQGNRVLSALFQDLDPRSEMSNLPAFREALGERLEQAAVALDGLTEVAPLDAAELKLEMASSMIGLGRYEPAISILQQAAELYRRELGAEHDQTLEALHVLAIALLEDGQWEEARAVCQKTLEIRQSTFGAQHRETLKSLGVLAECYRGLQQMDKALPLLKQIYESSVALLGSHDIGAIVSMHNLAEGYRMSGQLDEAKQWYERTLPVLQEEFGADFPGTLTCMNNLAAVYLALGEARSGLNLLQQVLELRTEILGPKHPLTLQTQSTLGSAWISTGNPAKGVPLLQAAWSGLQTALGGEHPDTLTALNNLARGYWATGQLEKSVPLFEELLATRREVLGREHPETRRAMANLGVNYLQQERAEEAWPLLESAWKESPNESEFDWVATPLRRAYLASGQHERFEIFLDELLKKVRERLPSESPEYAARLVSIGKDFFQIARWKKGGELLHESLEIQLRLQPTSWVTFDTQSLLGEALFNQGKTAEAEQLLVDGFQGLTVCPGYIPEDTGKPLVASLERLLMLYEQRRGAAQFSDIQQEVQAKLSGN